MQQGFTSAVEEGIPPENIISDPGIRFSKTWQQDPETVRRLRKLKELGRSILIGTSQTSLINVVLNLPATERVEGTATAVAFSIVNSADIARVHDVRQMVRVPHMTDDIVMA